MSLTTYCMPTKLATSMSIPKDSYVHEKLLLFYYIMVFLHLLQELWSSIRQAQTLYNSQSFSKTVSQKQ